MNGEIDRSSYKKLDKVIIVINDLTESHPVILQKDDLITFYEPLSAGYCILKAVKYLINKINFFNV